MTAERPVVLSGGDLLDGEWLSTEEVAKLLGVDPSTIRRWRTARPPGDIDRARWIWTVRRQTTPGPGGLIDKATKGKRARKVPIIEEARELVAARLDVVRDDDGCLFTGPRGGRISTAVLRDATHWGEVVTRLGSEHLRRHDLRHAD
jgi:Helix-turn-helix domain